MTFMVHALKSNSDTNYIGEQLFIDNIAIQ